MLRVHVFTTVICCMYIHSKIVENVTPVALIRLYWIQEPRGLATWFSLLTEIIFQIFFSLRINIKYIDLKKIVL